MNGRVAHAHNIALPQLGRDFVNSATTHYQLWFGARLFLRNCSLISLLVTPSTWGHQPLQHIHNKKSMVEHY